MIKILSDESNVKNSCLIVFPMKIWYKVFKIFFIYLFIVQNNPRKKFENTSILFFKNIFFWNKLNIYIFFIVSLSNIFSNFQTFP